MAAEAVLDHAPAREQVLSQLRAILPRILAGRPVLAAYLYGSVADGYARPDSDVDVALVLTADHGLSSYQRMLMELGIAAEIEDQGDLREVDVRSINDAPLVVQGTVMTEGILIYDRDEATRADYEVLTRKMYFDFLPVVKMMQDAYYHNKAAEFRRREISAHG
jgi:predicted nucleotidyltransferase